MPKNLPNGGVPPEARSALVCALREIVEVDDLVTMIVYGNEFQRREAMRRLEELSDTLRQEHLPLLLQVQMLKVKEEDCSTRCFSLASQIRSRFRQDEEVTATEAVA